MKLRSLKLHEIAIGILSVALLVSSIININNTNAVHTIELSDGKGGGGDVPMVVCINNTPTCVLATNPPSTAVSSTPTPTNALATATATPPSGAELLTNPGFEQSPAQPYHNYMGLVAYGWNGWYLIGSVPKALNPPPQSLNYGRFLEWNRCTVGNTDTARINSGNECQKWFSFSNQSFAGVYQTTTVPSNSSCIVSAYYHGWSNGGTSKDPHHSATETDDLMDAVTFLIGVDPTGGTNPQASTVVWKIYGVRPNNPYIKYVPVGSASYIYIPTNNRDDIYDPPSHKFEAPIWSQGSRLTVFLFSWRIWANQTNDSYLDDASLKCDSGASSTITPQPTQAPPATATAVAPTNTPVPGNTPQVTPTQVAPMTPRDEYPIYDGDINAIYQVINLAGLKKHNTRAIVDTNLVLPGYAYADEMPVRCIVLESADLEWGSEQPCKPEPTTWFMIRQGVKVFARLLTIVDPEG